jgi:hypothetical protein
MGFERRRVRGNARDDVTALLEADRVDAGQDRASDRLVGSFRTKNLMEKDVVSLKNKRQQASRT